MDFIRKKLKNNYLFGLIKDNQSGKKKTLLNKTKLVPNLLWTKNFKFYVKMLLLSVNCGILFYM